MNLTHDWRSHVRHDTIGLNGQFFLNSAGSSLPPKIVTETMVSYLKEEAKIGGYGLEKLRAPNFETFYIESAKLLNAKPHNMAFAYSSTDAYSKVLSAIPFKHNDCIITTTNDYISNQLSFLSIQKRFGVNILRAKNLPNGDMDLSDFEHLVQMHHPILIAVTQVPTNSGLVQPVEAVGKIAKKYNILYLLDACQAVGQMVVDVEKIGCDFLTATGRKFLRGPRSSGLLFVSDKVLATELAPLCMDRRNAEWIGANEYKIFSTAKRFESQEVSNAVLGLAQAIKYANDVGMENIFHYNQALIIKLRENLSALKHVQLLDKGSFLSNILTFRIDNKSFEKVVNKLDKNKVVYSTAFKNSAFIDFTEKGVDWAIRFSPHYFNTLEEMDEVTNIVSDIKTTLSIQT